MTWDCGTFQSETSLHRVCTSAHNSPSIEMAYTEAVKKRGVAKGRFTRLCHSISSAIDQGKPLELLDLLATDLKVAYEVVCTRHDDVVLHADANDDDDDWIAELEQRYEDVREWCLTTNYLRGTARTTFHVSSRRNVTTRPDSCH